MTTFYDILKPHLSETMTEYYASNRYVSEEKHITALAICGWCNLVVGSITAFFIVPFCATMGCCIIATIAGLISAGLLFAAFYLSALCDYKKNELSIDSLNFGATIENLYQKYIGPDRITTILKAEENLSRMNITCERSAAQKLYSLIQDSDTPPPDFNCDFSVRGWLSTEAKYLDLKEFMATYQV